ncbi:MAG: ATP-binding cassette domain-containing protein [Clostridiales bacterium]|nr:ATP-binding cassette domain-containing protein [Clostridiales bacterium]
MLKLKNLSKTFNPGTVNEKLVLDNVSLLVNEGDFVSVIGSNGAGKSTLLNAIAGSVDLDAGSIELNGREISQMPDVTRARFIGRVFQDPMMGTAPGMWIKENLSLAYRRTKRPTLRWALSSDDDEMYIEKLEKLGLGLEGRLKTKVGLLSGGQRQALTLLMATIQQPELLLLDEHTAALDPKTAKTVLELSADIIEKNNLTTLMVTHNMRNAIDYGNRLIMMHEGRIILDIEGEEKRRLSVAALMEMFERSSGEDFASDSALLGK